MVEAILLPGAQKKAEFIFEHAAGVTADFGRAQKSPVWADVGGEVNIFFQSPFYRYFSIIEYRLRSTSVNS